jgi:hypothetical protein
MRRTRSSPVRKNGCRHGKPKSTTTRNHTRGSARRDGRRHIYTVDDPHVLTLVQQIFAHIASDGSLAPDPLPKR